MDGVIILEGDQWAGESVSNRAGESGRRANRDWNVLHARFGRKILRSRHKAGRAGRPRLARDNRGRCSRPPGTGHRKEPLPIRKERRPNDRKRWWETNRSLICTIYQRILSIYDDIWKSELEGSGTGASHQRIRANAQQSNVAGLGSAITRSHGKKTRTEVNFSSACGP